MANVNRSVTPWLVVYGHRPQMTTSGHNGIDKQMLRANIGPLLHKYKVDLILSG